VEGRKEKWGECGCEGRVWNEGNWLNLDGCEENDRCMVGVRSEWRWSVFNYYL